MKINLFVKFLRFFVAFVLMFYLVVISAIAFDYLEKAFHLDSLDSTILKISMGLLSFFIMYRIIRDMLRE